MTDSLPEAYKNRLALTYVLDTNVVIDRAKQDVDALYLLRDRGWLWLQRVDVMETERTIGQDDSTRDERREEMRDLPEYLGVFVQDHSRLDSAVLGSAQDAGLMDQLRAVLFPGVKDWSKVRNNHVRDVMHVHTAVRYATTAFVTGEKHLLKRDRALLHEFGVGIWHPAAAIVEAQDRHRGMRQLHNLEPDRGALPKWPL